MTFDIPGIAIYPFVVMLMLVDYEACQVKVGCAQCVRVPECSEKGPCVELMAIGLSITTVHHDICCKSLRP